jgi:hypothetical protein
MLNSPIIMVGQYVSIKSKSFEILFMNVENKNVEGLYITITFYNFFYIYIECCCNKFNSQNNKSCNDLML